MYRSCFFLIVLIIVVASTIQASDIIQKENPGVWAHFVNGVQITYTASGNNLPANTLIGVNDVTGNRILTAQTNASGVVSGVSAGFGYIYTTSFTENVGNCGQNYYPTVGGVYQRNVETNYADRRASYTVGPVNPPTVSGGRWITFFWESPITNDPGCSGFINTPVSINYAIGPLPPTNGNVVFAGALHVPAYSSVHNLSLKINGVTVDTVSSIVNGTTVQNLDLSGSVGNVNTTGSTYQWLVDGFSQGGPNALVFTNIGSNEVPIWQANIGIDVTSAGGGLPTPTPALTPTATPYPTVTPVPGATPPPVPPGSTPPPSVIINSGGVTSGAVTVVNPQDIYRPILDGMAEQVKEGVTQSANSTINPGAVDTFSDGGPLDLSSNTNVLSDDVSSATTRLKTKATDLKDALNPSNHTFQGPSITNHSLIFAVSLPHLGAFSGGNSPTSQTSFNVDLTPYAAHLTLMRNIGLLSLYIWFWFAAAWAMRSGIS
jgi:hypothetical protein